MVIWEMAIAQAVPQAPGIVGMTVGGVHTVIPWIPRALMLPIQAPLRASDAMEDNMADIPTMGIATDIIPTFAG